VFLLYALKMIWCIDEYTQVEKEFGVANLDVLVEVPPGMVGDVIIESIRQLPDEM
jgi:hypothetical protein